MSSKARRPWTHDELRILRLAYGSQSDEWLVEAFGRELEDIDAKARELALAKNKAAHVGTLKMPRWTAADLELLRARHATTSNLELALILRRSVKSIASKSCALGLKKTGAYLEGMGRVNVKLRRDRLDGAGPV